MHPLLRDMMPEEEEFEEIIEELEDGDEEVVIEEYEEVIEQPSTGNAGPSPQPMYGQAQQPMYAQAQQPMYAQAQQPMYGQPMVQSPVQVIGPQKSVIGAYLLWFFLGWAGIHHLYVGRGIGIWLLSLVSFQGLGVWWLADLFLMPAACSKVRGNNYNIVR